MARAGIALGSNLGDRLAHLRAACAGLRASASPGEPVLLAAIYQTEPRLCPAGSPDFLNTVIEIGFAGTPLELLLVTRALEAKLGRIRGSGPNAPRVIDLDLLYLDDAQCQTDALLLPHPRLSQRRFVLQPLAEIRPDLVLPGQALTVAELLAALPATEPQLARTSATWLPRAP
ncbi:MAG: 2-amino-4-hydroxy-6-hydroxymethyldihydropteridine diphosphokinase [Verrucomicrobiota bacterium]